MFTYNPRGGRSTAARNGQTSSYSYDAFDRLIQVGLPGGVTVGYSYDSLDRLASRNQASFGYQDLSNRPSRAPAAGGEAVVSWDPAGGPVASRVGGGSAAVLLSDRHRDVVAGIDPVTGDVGASAAFSPWGASTVVGELPLGFQGGWTDPATGLVNAHSRWYDPAVAVFISRDSWTLPPAATPAINRYGYANADPLDGFDPTGHYVEGGGGGGASTRPVDCISDNSCNRGRDVCGAGCQAWPRISPATGVPAVERALRCGGVFEGIDGQGQVQCAVGGGLTGPSLANGMGNFKPGVVYYCSESADDASHGMQSGETTTTCGLEDYATRKTSTTLDSFAWTRYHAYFYELSQAEQEEIFAYALCNNSRTACDETYDDGEAALFETLKLAASMVPILGTGIDAIDCATGQASCAWLLIGLIPGAKLAKLAELGRLGELAASAGRAACSFSASTRVLRSDGSAVAIGDVEPGDEVLITDPDTGLNSVGKVTATWVHQDEIVELRIDGQVVETTADHPYWNVTERRWQRADELDPGDLLLTPTGAHATVDGITTTPPTQQDAYNLTTATTHTYYVLAGNTPVLVHNSGASQ